MINHKEIIKKSIIWIPILIFIGFILIIFIPINKMEQISQIKLSSPAFKNSQAIPLKYSCNGENINPPLLISNAPLGTKSLVLVVDDPDAPRGDWVHWLVWNIPADTSEITEHSPLIDSTQGLNDFGNNKYDGPCPPSGTHRYFLKLYALDTLLDLAKNSQKSSLEKAIYGHILGQTTLIGLYSK